MHWLSKLTSMEFTGRKPDCWRLSTLELRLRGCQQGHRDGDVAEKSQSDQWGSSCQFLATDPMKLKIGG